MEKYKKALCAFLVTASVAGANQIIIASTNKVEKVSGSNAVLSDEVIIPKRTLLVKAETNEFESITPQKIMNAKDVSAYKAEQAKAEAARLAKIAEKARLAKKAEEAKLAAKKAAEEKKVAAAKKAAAAKIAKSSVKITASRSAAVSSVSAEKASEIISYAKQFMGVQYVFGGATPSGFDCSGFTMYVFNKFGIDLPHSAKAQAGLGLAVSKSDLIPGDLVFFETYKPGISHVGIYVGGGNFIEASSSRGIAITSLSSSYYKTRYKGATRILK